ncbi:CBS domain-containing protein [Streptomyces sp. NPDC004539]|uniref:CBS domain-containing protein n=1 Tax=Streptomyces sp. NPDC004539 TaxID=3154280 RepID=UPI00339FCAF1
MSSLVQDVMKRNMAVVPPDMPVAQAAQRMGDGAAGVFVVVDGRLAGILTERDIVQRLVAAGADPQVVEVGSVCTSDPVTVRPEESVGRAEKVLRELSSRLLPVVDDGVLVGAVTLDDLIGPDGRVVDRSPLVAGHGGSGPEPAPGTPTSWPQEGRR